MSEMVPEGWEEKKLGDLSKIFFSNVDKKSAEDETPVLLCNYMDVYSNRTINKNLEFMKATAKQREIDKFLVCKGDVMITKDSETPSDIAVPSYVSEELKSVLCGYHLALIRPEKTSLSGEFLSYLFSLESIQHRYYQLANGSTRFGLTADVITDSPLPIPPLPEQKKIASILTSVDEVIDKTQSQIDKLQDLKKGTMNELLTKGIGHTEFKDSELGRIPKSWEVKRLDEVSKISRGKFSHRPRNDPAFYDGNHPYLQTGDIPTDVTNITSFTQTLNDKGLGVSKLFSKGTLVLTIAATIGEVGILTFNSCFPDSLVGINCKTDKVTPYFLLYSLRMAKQKLISEAPESAQKNLNLDILNPFLIAVPELNEQKEIETILLSIDHNLKEKSRKLHQTQSLKKSLMQDLLTGKVRVSVN